jgi:hypothetical protein
MGHRPFGGAPGCDGQCAGRSQVAVAWSAVTEGLGRRILWLRPFQPFRSWVLLAADVRPAASKRSTGLRRRGGVAIDRHER